MTNTRDDIIRLVARDCAREEIAQGWTSERGIDPWPYTLRACRDMLESCGFQVDGERDGEDIAPYGMTSEEERLFLATFRATLEGEN